MYYIHRAVDNKTVWDLVKESGEKAVPCPLCGFPIPLTKELCTYCWQVTVRLEDFLLFPKARKYLKVRLENWEKDHPDTSEGNDEIPK